MQYMEKEGNNPIVYDVRGSMIIYL